MYRASEFLTSLKTPSSCCLNVGTVSSREPGIEDLDGDVEKLLLGDLGLGLDGVGGLDCRRGR